MPTLKIKTAIQSRRACLAGYALLLLAPLSAIAQQIQVTLDPAQTTIEWTLVTTLHTVHGTFKMKSGTVSFDPKSGTANGVIIVDATSGDSENHARDNKMHKDVLESQRYPEISFIPQRVIGSVPQTGSATIQVQGLFHIHGSNHDFALSIPVQINGNEVKASTSLSIPYQDWGMKDPGNFLLHVDKKVAVNVSTVGHMAQINGAPAAH